MPTRPSRVRPRRKGPRSRATRFVGQKLGTSLAKQNGDDLLALKELVEAGEVAPVIGSTYSLEHVPEVISHLTAVHNRGKVVITV